MSARCLSGPITITGKQRNLLYLMTLDFMGAGSDAYHSASDGRYEEADRLALRTCDELTFVLNDLRWKERPDDEVIPLLTSPAIVRRVVNRILVDVEGEVLEGTQAEINEFEKERRELRSVCEDVLTELPLEGAAG